MQLDLLAKQPFPDRSPVTLADHTRDVIAAARELFGTDSPSRLGSRWLSFFDLSESSWPGVPHASLGSTAACTIGARETTPSRMPSAESDRRRFDMNISVH